LSFAIVLSQLPHAVASRGKPVAVFSSSMVAQAHRRTGREDSSALQPVSGARISDATLCMRMRSWNPGKA
jgi:hypothetical protein